MLFDPAREKRQQQQLEPWRLTLLNAALVIEEKGHCKHMLQNGIGNVCFLGAIGVAVNGNAWVGISVKGAEAFDRMEAFLNQDPVDWNNHPETTAQDVIRAMRDCANQR